LQGESDPPDYTSKPYLLPISADDEGVPKAHPIARFAGFLQAYIVYLLPRDEEGTTFDLRVLDVWRKRIPPDGLTPWQASIIYRLDSIAIEPTRPGALGRTWRDAVPVSFAVGKGPHLYLAWRQRTSSTGKSEVFLLDCDATAGVSCIVEQSGQNSSGWRIRAVGDIGLASPYAGSKYQPVVGADRDSDAVSIAWLEETSPGSAQVSLVGMVSRDGGDIFDSIHDLRTNNGGPWTPCPTAAAVDASTSHYYASRASSIVLPYDPHFDPAPTTVTAHADSRDCQSLGELTYDLHVGVLAW
jgi:hypothetical protein